MKPSQNLMAKLLSVGIDIRRTGINAALVANKEILNSVKVPTTCDIEADFVHTLTKVLVNQRKEHVVKVVLGTTGFMEALTEGRNLSKVAVIRLCGDASRSLPPFSGFPEKLKKIIYGGSYCTEGGFLLDGRTISEVSSEDIERICDHVKDNGVRNIVLSGLFSPKNATQEQQVSTIVKNHFHNRVSVTRSSDTSGLGLLEREKSSILNETLKFSTWKYLSVLYGALKTSGITCPFYMTANNGKLINFKHVLEMPVLALWSGITNSMQGAGFLASLENAIVADIGDDQIEVGVLVRGSPRCTSADQYLQGVRVNMQIPDVYSKELGIVMPNGELDSTKNSVVDSQVEDKKAIESQSVFGNGEEAKHDTVFQLQAPKEKEYKKSEMFGNNLSGHKMRIRQALKDAIDHVKTSSLEIPLILIGKGAEVGYLTIKGCPEIIVPKHGEIASAVGAAVSSSTNQVSSAYNENKEVESAFSEFENVFKRFDVSDQEKNPDKKTLNPMETLPPILADTQPMEKQLDPNGDWLLTPSDIDCISIGASIMGCGGGGSTHLNALYVKSFLQKGQPIRIRSLDSYSETESDAVSGIPIGMMGAPTVCTEQLFSGEEIECLKAMAFFCNLSESEISKQIKMHQLSYIENERFSFIEDFSEVLKESQKEFEDIFINFRENFAVVPIEIGGGNALIPLAVASSVGLPVLDCDLMGRAFPELQMMATFVHGLNCYPSVLSSFQGRTAIVTKCNKPKDLEDVLRKVVVEMGLLGTLTTPPVKVKDLKQLSMLCTYSECHTIGKAILNAKMQNLDPIDALKNAREDMTILVRGKITDIQTKTEGGFTKGRFVVESFATKNNATQKLEVEAEKVIIEFQNEYIIAFRNDDVSEPLATVPNLISVIDLQRVEGVTSADLKYGLRVCVIVLKANFRLLSETSMEFVGPRAFGYDYSFVPML